MPTLYYDVILQTLIGERSGKMHLQFQNSRIKGLFHVFGNTQPVHGECDSHGNSTLKGKLVTLMNEYCYTATGQANQKYLDLIIRSDRGSFYLTGQTNPQAETAEE